MTRSTFFSPASQSDIDEIYEFTVKNWGTSQAENYIQQLQEICHALAKAEKQGQKIDHIRKGYLRFSVGSHFIFYQQSSSEIRIIRILHKRMDFEKHFF